MVPIDSYYNYKKLRIDVTDLDMFLLDDPCLTGENVAAANRYSRDLEGAPIAKIPAVSEDDGGWGGNGALLIDPSSNQQLFIRIKSTITHKN